MNDNAGVVSCQLGSDLSTGRAIVTWAKRRVPRGLLRRKLLPAEFADKRGDAAGDRTPAGKEVIEREQLEAPPAPKKYRPAPVGAQ